MLTKSKFVDVPTSPCAVGMFVLMQALSLQVGHGIVELCFPHRPCR